MAKLQTVEMKIPFPGFYNSLYSDLIDQEESQYADHHCDESDGDENEWPEALRLDSDFYAETLLRVTDYRKAYVKIAGYYVDAFSYGAGEAMGISAPQSVRVWDWKTSKHKREKRNVESLRFTWAAMESPREYNFETDRIFVNVPLSVVRKLWSISKGDDHATLTRIALERHSSRSGFISGYRNNWESWGAVSEWDHNQLETLLIAACEVSGFDHDDSDLTLYYAVSEDSGGYQAWESAVDWKDFDARRDEARAEKLAQWLESDPEAAKRWIGQDGRACDLLRAAIEWPNVDLSSVPYRCPTTPDLFADLES